MVHDSSDVPAGPANLDSVQVRFDEQRLVSNAGLLVAATLAERLGIEELVNESVGLDPRLPGACLPGRKVMSLVHGMLAGADSIDDMNVLRAGSTQMILGHRVMAPSTLGTFLRAFTFGHVRQLDRVLDHALARAWEAGAGPGDGMPLVIDIDSFVGEVHGYQKQGASYGYTKKLGYHPILAVRADTGEVLHIRNRKGKANTQRGIARFVDELIARVRRAGHAGQIIIRADSGFENHKLFNALAKRGIEFSIAVKQSKTIRALIEQIDQADWVTVADYPDEGEAQVAETTLKGFRLIVRRTRLLGAQAELFPDWRYHCLATNRATPPTMIADIDHRDHATVELAIRDLIDQALKHFPSGQMHANSAWTVIAVLAWISGASDRPVLVADSD
ncbi:MAG: IS1380 family transposase [Solirubrobacteraceae bacterium]